MRLLNERKEILVENLEVASSLWSRTRGLLGRDSLANNEGLWIKKCNNVHTFFMKFPIDLIFLNDEMKVTKIVRNIPPARIVLSMLVSTSVVELSSGFLDRKPVQLGEQLHVDPALS